jgi:hypothetical protein
VSTREAALARLRALLGDADRETSDERLMAIGAVARVASGDAEDEAAEALVTEATALLEQARTSVAHADAIIPDGSDVLRWLSDTRAPFSAALGELDRLGLVASGLAIVAPDSDAATRATARVTSLAEAIADTAREHGGRMVSAAMAASEHLSTHGVDLPADAALVALADVLAARLDAALHGHPLETPSPVRSTVMDRDRATHLGFVLAKALGRAAFHVTPDLLELAPGGLGGPASSREVVLHEAPEFALPPPVELLRGVRVSSAHGEVVVTLTDRDSGPVLLVPIEHGEPGAPCSSRGGARADERVFTLRDKTPSLDGYALVVGDRLAFLKIK